MTAANPPGSTVATEGTAGRTGAAGESAAATTTGTVIIPCPVTAITINSTPAAPARDVGIQGAISPLATQATPAATGGAPKRAPRASRRSIIGEMDARQSHIAGIEEQGAACSQTAAGVITGIPAGRPAIRKAQIIEA